MKSRLTTLVVLGAAISLLAAFLASPRFWEPPRVEQEAEALLEKGEAAGAAMLYRFAAKHQRDRYFRDEFLLSSCRILYGLSRNEDALSVCSEVAEEPRRAARADALLMMAQIQKELRNLSEAKALLKKIGLEYWDYRQALTAGRELSRLMLQEVLRGTPSSETQGEVESLVRKVGASRFDDPLVRSVRILALIRDMDEGRLPDRSFFDVLRASYDTEGTRVFLERLGALSWVHPRGNDLRRAAKKAGVPLRDAPEDLIRCTAYQDESPPTHQEISRALSKMRNLPELIRAFDLVGDQSAMLRVHVARFFRRDGRVKDTVDLLSGLMDSSNPNPAFAEATFVMADALQRMGRGREAVRFWERVIETWPQHGGTCVRSARAAADVYIERGERKAARDVLLKASKVAVGEERLSLLRRALELE